MEKEFNVSLVITTYNEEKYLPILIGSIESQKTSLSMEVLIVDDGSTDKTLELVADYIAKNEKEENPSPYIRYKLINNDNPHDVRYMRNLGLNHALGKTVIFCDADIALSANYIDGMVSPIVNGHIDIMLCKTYAILEGFYDVRPDKYSKSYDFYLKYAPKFMLKRFPVQLVPWLVVWFENMKRHKKYLSIWTTPNRAHTTGICTKTSISRKVGGWNAPIGHGDDARYSLDIFEATENILFDRKSVLYVSRRRVFPHNAANWLVPKFLRKKFVNDYSQSAR